MDARLEILDALVDGERVDAALLKRALADEAGREYLVDAWLLREHVQDEMAADARAALPVSAGLPSAPTRTRGALTWLLVASAAAACLLAGFAGGYRLGERAMPAAIESAVPAGSSGVKSIPAVRSFPVPPPTRVIRVEFNSGAPGGGD